MMAFPRRRERFLRVPWGSLHDDDAQVFVKLLEFEHHRLARLVAEKGIAELFWIAKHAVAVSVVAGSASFQSEDTGGPFFRTDAKLGHGGGEAGVSGLLNNVLGAFEEMERGLAAGYGKLAW